MKTLFLYALATILVSLPVHSSVITVTDGIIDCAGIDCPKETRTCHVTKKTCNDLASYKYFRSCTDAFGIPTNVASEDLVNPSPDTSINTILKYNFEERRMSIEELNDFQRRLSDIAEIA